MHFAAQFAMVANGLVCPVLAFLILPLATRAFTRGRQHYDPFWALFCGFMITRTLFIISSMVTDQVVKDAMVIFVSALSVLLAFCGWRMTKWYRDA